MAREFNKKGPFKKGKGKGKKKGPTSARPEESFHKRTFGRSNEKKGFDPNADLAHGEESYSVRKRKNLLDQDRKFSEEKTARSEEGRSSDKPARKTFGKPFKKSGAGFKKRENTGYKRRDDNSEERPRRFGKAETEAGKKSFGNPFRKSKDADDSSYDEPGSGPKRRENTREERPSRSDKPARKSFEKPFNKFKKEKTGTPDEQDGSFEKPYIRNTPGGSSGVHKPFKKKFVKKASGPSYKKLTNQDETPSDGLVRLNKYISNAGICSRREADELIRAGVVRVNGKVVTEMGYKVQPDDLINYGGETLRKEKLVYVLLNKPKDFITTLDDPANRKTVFDLVRNACKERIYPVGRLDRNTTGVLLLTNDGDLTKKLTHPKHGIKKVYMVTLDEPLNKPDFDEIANNGVTLDDGHIKPDVISYAGDGSNKKEVGLEIHSGRNRIVRRLFEQFGYTVVKLDRVVFAGLTKKDLPRGNWRILSEKEVSFLKMLG
jgi:23S rRNA pseudouridine2605 synthase